MWKERASTEQIGNGKHTAARAKDTRKRLPHNGAHAFLEPRTLSHRQSLYNRRKIGRYWARAPRFPVQKLGL